MEIGQAIANAPARPQAGARSGRTGAIVAFVLGLFLLAGVGFAGPHAIHEAVHDARHAAGFPCH